MDLRDKFLEDLFDAMHQQDKGNPDYKNVSDNDRIAGRPIAEIMLDKGWYLDPEKGKK